MEFSVKERLQLGELLASQPEKGSVATFRIVNELREALSFDESEWEEFELVQRGSVTQWNQERARAKEIEVGPKAFEVVKGVFEELDAAEALPKAYFDVAVRFLGDE